ncbi:hypothetical protein HDU67_000672 [Dinochytrium kinnereticum]|nr:hypothetical protein HDU67_000672 [Dinochytrium kinnereticum]
MSVYGSERSRMVMGNFRRLHVMPGNTGKSETKEIHQKQSRIPVSGTGYGLKLPRMTSSRLRVKSNAVSSHSILSSDTIVKIPSDTLPRPFNSIDKSRKHTPRTSTTDRPAPLPRASGPIIQHGGAQSQDIGHRFILALSAIQDAIGSESRKTPASQYCTLILSECMTVLHMYKRIAASGQLISLKGPVMEVSASLHLLADLVEQTAPSDGDRLALVNISSTISIVPIQVILEVVDPGGKGYLRAIVHSSCPPCLQKAYVRFLYVLLAVFPEDTPTSKSIVAAATIALRWINGDVLESALIMLSPHIESHMSLCIPFVRALAGLEDMRRERVLRMPMTMNRAASLDMHATVMSNYMTLSEKSVEPACISWNLEFLQDGHFNLLLDSWWPFGVALGVTKLFHTTGFHSLSVAFLQILLSLSTQLLVALTRKESNTPQTTKYFGPYIPMPQALAENLRQTLPISPILRHSAKSTTPQQPDFWSNLFLNLLEGVFASLTSDETSGLACSLLDAMCQARGADIETRLPRLSGVLDVLCGQHHGQVASKKARERVVRLLKRWMEEKGEVEDGLDEKTKGAVQRGIRQAVENFRARHPTCEKVL